MTIFESLVFDCDEIDYVGGKYTNTKIDEEQHNAQWEVLVINVEKETSQEENKGQHLNEQRAEQWVSKHVMVVLVVDESVRQHDADNRENVEEKTTQNKTLSHRYLIDERLFGFLCYNRVYTLSHTMNPVSIPHSLVCLIQCCVKSGIIWPGCEAGVPQAITLTRIANPCVCGESCDAANDWYQTKKENEDDERMIAR